MSSGFKKTDKKGAPVPEINQPAAETAARQPGTEVPAETAEKKQSSGWKEIVYPLLAAVVIIGLWFGNIVIMSVNSKVFLQNTTMNGQDISGMTPAEAAGLIVDAYQNSSVSLMEDGKPVLTGDLKSYGFELDEEGLLKTMEQTLQEEKSSIGSIFNSITVGNEIGSDVLWNYDENTFKDKVRASSLTAARFPSENAYIDYSEKEGRCVIVDEVYGNEFEDADLQAWMKDSLDAIKDAPDHNFQQELPFPEQIYKKPAVTKDDADLIAETEAVNQYSGARVNYEFGEKTQVLGFDTIWSWFDLQGGEAHLNDDKVTEFVQGLEDRYNTRYRERTFINHYGNEVHFSPGDNEYGYTIIEQEEIDRLKEDILSGEEVSREPVYDEENAWGNPYYLGRNGEDDLAGTYVEVNLSAQHLWFYKDGEVFLETDIVSGDIAKGRSTKTGVFPLAYKESPSILRGGNGPNGYETKVQYWMPFYEGQGLHDADWRGSFGGSIYRSNGSHGCVNLPPWAAAEIYHNISAGTAILIYW